MGALYSALAAVVLILFVIAGWGLGWHVLFTVVFPYAAAAAFIAGFIYRVLKWAKAPVPFRIATVCGQQKSLPWIKDNRTESPSTSMGVVARIALEVLFFRSLLHNEKVELKEAHKLIYRENILLWLGGLAFHWSLLAIVLRHARFFLEPIPSWVLSIQWLDEILYNLFQGLIPFLYISDVVILIALTYLFVRRVIYPQIRYLSLPSDYFVLLVLFCAVASGILMRLFFKVDLESVKEWVMGMLSLHPSVPKGVNVFFYIHLFFVVFLAAYFPVSKLMHMGGIFLSPTRNLANTSRRVRHVNPWDYPVKVHTYEEYEDEFRGPMKEVGLPLDKE
jgi:nitrate reductase gamma subunit